MIKDENIKNEHDVVDNSIITANISFMVSFIIILSIKRPESNYIIISSITSLVGLTFSLLFSFWHKYRMPIKNNYYQKLKNDIISNTSDELVHFSESYFLPLVMYDIEKIKKEKISTSIDSLIDSAVKTQNDKAYQIIKTHIENFQFKMQDLKNKIYNTPLKEDNAKAKFIIDKISETFRYILFFIGVFFFLITIVLSLLIVQ